ncbi:unnamed protein product [Urochloa decumbens]|uniref:DUF7769 domain-containing protein n=1 Tax=Urochloa decumbens TaxID=240449 RepID=A0ABC9A9R5_9POAL
MCRTAMAVHPFDLNLEPPVLDLNNPTDWNGIPDWDTPAHGLELDMAWEDGEQGDGVALGGGDENAAGLQDDVNEKDVVGPMGHGGVRGNAAGGSNMKKRRYYSDELKIAIYLELLAKTHPPVLHHGVSKAVALKFDVPVKVVQRVWRNGQDYGTIEGVKNKLVKNCGRKKIEIDVEAIKAVPLRERKTIQDLANALDVKKTTLYNRFKKGYFRRHTKENKKHLGMQGDLPLA